MMPLRALSLLVALSSGAWAARTAPARGVALGLFAEDPGWSYRPLLEEIARTGADHVELVVAWYERDGSATEIGAHPRYTAPAASIRAAVRAARAVGLEVLLFPIVRLSAPRPGEWRGNLQPRDHGSFFRSYGAELEALARLAAAEGASELSIGSELSTLDGAGDHTAWATLVARVRRLYRGKLLYSSNWDHYGEVGIFDLVDEVGLCAYFALVAADAPSTEEVLVHGWRAWREELTRFRRALGRPLVLTEVGYRSVAGAAAAPWDEGARGPVDLDEQRRCYAAFRRVWQDAPAELLAGAYFWNWYGWGGAASRGYTPRGKPAADELRALFSAWR